jgi:hypothetical protein
MKLWFLLLTLNGTHPESVKAFWEDKALCIQSQIKWQQLGYEAECRELPQYLPYCLVPWNPGEKYAE